MGQHHALTRCQLRGEQQIRAECRFDPVSFCEPICPIRAGKNLKLVNSALAGQTNQVVVPDKRLNAQPHTFVRHQPGGRFVHQVTVLDAPSPGGNRPLDRTWRISVHRDVGGPISGGFDRRAQLGFAMVNASSGLRGEETPPLPTSLICEAPCNSCSRTRSRTASGPSAMMLAPVCSID